MVMVIGQSHFQGHGVRLSLPAGEAILYMVVATFIVMATSYPPPGTGSYEQVKVFSMVFQFRPSIPFLLAL